MKVLPFMTLYPYAQIRIYASESLEEVAAILSEKLFGNVPFGDKELGIFEEVPGIRLKGNFLGLFVALHGFDGEYTLLVQPTPAALRGLADTRHVNLGHYIAFLVKSLERWRVEVVPG
jgi:hypothetical protein